MNMNRRGFLAGLASVAAVVATPIRYVRRKLGFAEAMEVAVRANASRLADNVTRNNALFERLRKS